MNALLLFSAIYLVKWFVMQCITTPMHPCERPPAYLLRKINMQSFPPKIQYVMEEYPFPLEQT